MLEIKHPAPAHKSHQGRIDEGADFDAALIIAERFRLPLSHARVVVALAGLGRDSAMGAR